MYVQYSVNAFLYHVPTHRKTAGWFICPSLDIPFLQPVSHLDGLIYDERLTWGKGLMLSRLQA